MDLQDFNSEMLYFETANSEKVDALLEQAATLYGPESETLLLQAQQLAPENLTVLVGLYRFYYYQHRYTDALQIAHKVMRVVAPQIQFPEQWQELDMACVTRGITFSFTLVRFYLFALKAAGYISLRLKQFEQGRAMVEKVVALDSANRLGAQLLLDVLKSHTADVVPFTQYRDPEVEHGSRIGR